MSDNTGELSDVAVAMSVFFKRQRASTPSECTPKVRKRLESVSTDSPIEKLITKQERAERNRANILESRVRALSDADELRLQKLEAVEEEKERKAETLQRRQCRAAKNRHRLLSQRSLRLKHHHSLIENQLNIRKGEEQEARNQLSVIFERRGRQAAQNRNEHIRDVAKKARDTNPTKEVEDKKEELLEQWEEKIERARKKRLQLLQQKASGM